MFKLAHSGNVWCNKIPVCINWWAQIMETCNISNRFLAGDTRVTVIETQQYSLPSEYVENRKTPKIKVVARYPQVSVVHVWTCLSSGESSQIWTDIYHYRGAFFASFRKKMTPKEDNCWKVMDLLTDNAESVESSECDVTSEYHVGIIRVAGFIKSMQHKQHDYIETL